MVQVPMATSVTVEPETVQTLDVVEAKLTERPDDAVALTVKGVVPRFLADNAAKVMVWLAAVTRKLWLTGAAAE